MRAGMEKTDTLPAAGKRVLSGGGSCFPHPLQVNLPCILPDGDLILHYLGPFLVSFALFKRDGASISKRG